MRRNQFQKLFLRELRPVSFVELYARSLESSSPERLRLINGQSAKLILAQGTVKKRDEST